MTLADQIAATRDNDLLARMIAAAQKQGIPNAQAWAEQHRGALVATPVTPGGDTLSSVLAYARGQKGLPAGADPAIVTDEFVTAAVVAINTGSAATVLD